MAVEKGHQADDQNQQDQGYGPDYVDPKFLVPIFFRQIPVRGMDHKTRQLFPGLGVAALTGLQGVFSVF